MSSSCVSSKKPSCRWAKTALALITIFEVSAVHSEQVTTPDTVAGRVLAAWLDRPGREAGGQW